MYFLIYIIVWLKCLSKLLKKIIEFLYSNWTFQVNLLMLHYIARIFLRLSSFNVKFISIDLVFSL